MWHPRRTPASLTFVEHMATKLLGAPPCNPLLADGKADGTPLRVAPNRACPAGGPGALLAEALPLLTEPLVASLHRELPGHVFKCHVSECHVSSRTGRSAGGTSRATAVWSARSRRLAVVRTARQRASSGIVAKAAGASGGFRVAISRGGGRGIGGATRTRLRPMRSRAPPAPMLSSVTDGAAAPAAALAACVAAAASATDASANSRHPLLLSAGSARQTASRRRRSAATAVPPVLSAASSDLSTGRGPGGGWGGHWRRGPR